MLLCSKDLYMKIFSLSFFKYLSQFWLVCFQDSFFFLLNRKQE